MRFSNICQCHDRDYLSEHLGSFYWKSDPQEANFKYANTSLLREDWDMVFLSETPKSYFVVCFSIVESVNTTPLECALKAAALKSRAPDTYTRSFLRNTGNFG